MPDPRGVARNMSPVRNIYPERLEDAVEKLRAAIQDCETQGIAVHTIIAAMMTELMPRFVETYGAMMWGFPWCEGQYPVLN
jgi:hypothetical protein